MKKIIMYIIVLISMIFIILGVGIICKNKVEENKTIEQISNKFDLILSGNSLEANFEFVDNYNNKNISKSYLNMTNEELLENGYIEYIQSTDYMIKFYSKILIQEVSIKEETDDKIICIVSVKRPNSLEIMNECDTENINNENYDFNSTFINKLESGDYKNYEETVEIIVKKVNDELKFKYDESFKILLYG